MKAIVLACSICLIASTVEANVITIDPNNFPLGTDLSHLFDGVTLQKVTNRSNTDGVEGRETFQPIASAVHALPSYHLESGLSIGGMGIEIYAYKDCRNSGPWGNYNCPYYDVLSLNFAAATDFISIAGAFYSDRPSVLAYDVAGNPISFLPGEVVETYVPVAYQESYQFLLTISRPQADIAELVFGGVSGNSTATKIEYERHKVPAPSTLLVTAIGALAFARRRRR